MNQKIRKSHYHADMLSVEDAREKILSKFEILNPTQINILDSVGSIVSEDIISEINVPPLDNSAMDGYAVIKDDLINADDENIIYLDVIEEIPAGSIPKLSLSTGQASRIMTGAPIPSGSDAVVPFEDTNELENNDKSKIGIKISVKNLENIRKKSEDIKKGSIIIKKGSLITSATIGVMASIGLEKVSVIRKPIIGILSTGNELLEPGEKNQDGKIYNSNTYTLSSLVKEFGATPLIQKHALDKVEDLEKKLKKLRDVDLIVTSAGVSKGDYDIVKDVLDKNGDINLWSVNMRPAKPLAFGIITIDGKKIPLLGVPGNPVSAMIAFEKFGRYAIDKMKGKPLKNRPIIKANLESDIINHDGRRLYSRVKVIVDSSSKVIAIPIKNQSSGVLTSMHEANGLAICPSDIDILKKGEKIDVEMFNWNENISDILNNEE
ncbi:MAG: molybdopterin molybdenumtransferase MoeA [Chloroflexi bacterium]|jgi:molybdopterin molybdotransferase|nr:MAG: molybdopterin molybdenumtransferase MoeA [SAR202 cluster bacterium]KAA1298517.1 MAG: molybdopterin molybdenumtransferase MoeA [SAR202 cluster bacterium]MAX11918.1 molybdopterin molybdenumtransferase MoeA [Chloroflexota bacterium]|tara:strand:+ start:1998 stop:3305 length:1308 start_codon:yes stop_codon:yes gene_type:complete